MTKSIAKIEYIESVAKFDRATIDRLIEYLEDDFLAVRYRAYCKLHSANLESLLSEPERKLLSRGVLLYPNDVVWSVYQSGLDYDDSEYGICEFPDDSGKNIYGEGVGTNCYDLWNREVPHKFISTFHYY